MERPQGLSNLRLSRLGKSMKQVTIDHLTGDKHVIKTSPVYNLLGNEVGTNHVEYVARADGICGTTFLGTHDVLRDETVKTQK